MNIEANLEAALGEESRPIEFPSGLIGLEDWQRFVLISHPAGESLRLLQSLQEERLSFIVADPREIISDYRLTLSAADMQALQLANGHKESWLDDLDMYCILSVQEEPFSVTVNLLAPLVINWQAGLGRQVILPDSNYNSRHPLAGERESRSPELAGVERERA